MQGFGGGRWTRTNGLRIMSQATDSENKGNPALSPAESGKVLQNPHPPATNNQLFLLSTNRRVGLVFELPPPIDAESAWPVPGDGDSTHSG